ncbi:MAG: metal-sulfur cluster assembly factor [Spirochaetales bacterium]|nr:metal-sulfur cluster assembly factor [Spirochaetales bacterium]
MVEEAEIMHILDDIYDPELNIPVTELGLIYRVERKQDGIVEIDFTATYPGCPAVEILYDAIQANVGRLEGVSDVRVQVVWDPPWNAERMSEEARFALGYPL